MYKFKIRKVKEKRVREGTFYSMNTFSNQYC